MWSWWDGGSRSGTWKRRKKVGAHENRDVFDSTSASREFSNIEQWYFIILTRFQLYLQQQQAEKSFDFILQALSYLSFLLSDSLLASLIFPSSNINQSEARCCFKWILMEFVKWGEYEEDILKFLVIFFFRIFQSFSHFCWLTSFEKVNCFADKPTTFSLDHQTMQTSEFIMIDSC